MLSRVKLISEPWDLGPGGYQLGNHPPGFAEWNDRFRDGVRRFWRGDRGPARRARGAARGLGRPVRHARARRPWASVNFVTAHDGFTLADLVSYAEQHNEANGEDNRDGHDDNSRPTGASRARPTIPPSTRRAPRVQRATAGDAVPVAGHADAAGAATSSAARRAATTTPTARTTRSPGSTGSRPTAPRGQDARRLRGAPDRACATRIRCCAAAASCTARTSRRPACRDIAWFDTHGEIDLERVLEQSRRSARWRCAAPRATATAAFDPDAVASIRSGEDRIAFACRRHGRPARLLLDSAEPDAPERDLGGDEIDGRAAQRRADREHASRTGRHDRRFARDAAVRRHAGRRRTARAFACGRPAQQQVVGSRSKAAATVPMTRDAGRLVRGRGAVRRRHALSLSAGDGLAVPDPASRAQADDVHGPSLVVDPRAYRWRNAGLARPALARNRALRAACRRAAAASPACSASCRDLAELGVTADRADAGRRFSRHSATGAMTACCPSRRIAPTARPTS